MPTGRRSSNNPFQEALSADSTGNSHNSNNSPPTYPSNTNNNEYYTSDEKSRLRREREREAANNTRETNGGSDLPPSYEEAAGPNSRRSEYPREKAAASSTSRSEEHRTRVHREWPGESRSAGTRERSSSNREHSSRSQRPRESSSRHGSSSRTGEHRSRHESSSSREHREHREHRSKSSKESRSKSSKKKDEVPPKNVDTIDKLDVTGLFGGAFHHDGPFDACTPHRNKNTKSAPVLAFPADGPNNSIRGSGPIDARSATLNYIQGRDENEDLYSTSVSKNYERSNNSQSTISAIKANGNIVHVDTNATSNPIHGNTTLGLGSSTFLDGAPVAPKVAYEEASKSGLSRKKSLKQKLSGTSPDSNRPRAFSGTRDEYDEYGLKFSNEAKEKESGGNSLLRRVKSLKVGRTKS